MTKHIAVAEEHIFAAMKKLTEQQGPTAPGNGFKIDRHFAGLSLIRKDMQKEPERTYDCLDLRS